jgi:hypothetical protein
MIPHQSSLFDQRGASLTGGPNRACLSGFPSGGPRLNQDYQAAQALPSCPRATTALPHFEVVGGVGCGSHDRRKETNVAQTAQAGVRLAGS